MPNALTVGHMKSFGLKFFENFNKHDLMSLSAALAFYTALSLAPLLIITLAVVGLLGESSQNQFLIQVHSLMGDEAAKAVTAIVQGADNKPQTGTLAGIIGVIVLIFSASGVFAQLQFSLNVIWEAQAKASAGAMAWIKKRLLSMGMVLTLGFLAIISLVVSTVMSFMFSGEGALWALANNIVSLAIFAVMFAAIFKYLPDTKITWKSAFIGGAVTAILFLAGKGLIGLYLGKSAVGSAYGAAGSLVVLLAWVYYSSIIMFAGAEVTRILTEPAGQPANA